jgi:hypothetical protein
VLLFTGYVALFPEATFRGSGVTGARYQQTVTAISDELLLDQQSVPVTSTSIGLSAAVAMKTLTQRVDPVRVGFVPTAGAPTVLVAFGADAAEAWSVNAGVLAGMARAGYRVMGGQVSAAPIGETTHAFSDIAGTLDLTRFSIQQSRNLANDVTVCGESEPQTYVTDVFQGDGATTTFDLTKTPLRVSAVRGDLVSDSFAGPGINTVLWSLSDAGSRLSITAAGLTVNGGNGVDGGTTLTAIDNVEMGGSLVLTTGGVSAAAGSDGYVGCLYSGSVLLVNLFAGFHVTQSSGSTVVFPMVNGVIAGASATLIVGHAYTFRLRYACREMQRLLTSYYMTGATGPQEYGGGLVNAPAYLVLEVQDTTGGVNQATLVLYDGAVSTAPAACILCAINSPAFTGSIQSVNLEQTGTAWVRSLQTTGSAFTRRIGLATTGADCKIGTTDKLVFYTTSVPQIGELISLSYRTAGLAVARMSNPASVAAQGTATVPGVSRWIGSVTSPRPRSSADCENAGLALLAVSTSASAAWAGKYVVMNPQQGLVGDVWPGDALALQATSLNLTASVIVRSVSVAYTAAQPELLTYTIVFANDWADAISVKISNAVPKDVWLPPTALAATTALQSLPALSANISATQIAVTANASPPTGGGFEVRRVDWQFGPGSDGTLVLRSPVANFTIIRAAAIEQYYVRMYDGSTPPNYSRFSSAICAVVPV